MIAHIKGVVTQAQVTSVVIDVAGVGYRVHTMLRTACAQGETVLLYTHLAVRENAMDLYGFLSHEELSFFELLLTLPKIGPKSAMQILSQADVSLLKSSIVSQDPTHLSKMSGVSKKTAEKVVYGLKDTFEDQSYTTSAEYTDTVANSFASDTIDALITLGYPQVDARKAVQQLIASKPEITKVNEAIKEVLKILG